MHRLRRARIAATDTRRLRAAGLAMLIAMAPTPAMAGESLDRYMFNSNGRDLTSEIAQMEGTRQRLNAASDNQTGCTLVRDMLRHLQRISELSERQAGLSRKLGERDNFDTALELRQTADDEHQQISAGLLRKCQGLGL